MCLIYMSRFIFIHLNIYIQIRSLNDYSFVSFLFVTV